jgi:putative ABC transport system permease protein
VASVISGLESYVQEKMITLSPDVFVVTKFGIIMSREGFFEALKRPDLDYRDHETLRDRLARAAMVGADVGTGGPVKYGGRRLTDIRIHGTSANFGAIMNLEIEAGRYFSESEALSGQNVAVIGWDVRDELFRGLDPLGRDVTIGSAAYRVVGLMAQQGSVLGQSQDNQVWIPMNAFRRAYGRRNSLDILVKARGGIAGVEASVDEVRSVLRALRHTPFRDPDPFAVVTLDNAQQAWRQISSAAFLLTLLISGVSLGVGGVVIANILLVGVVERTREIGVRMAMGARKRDIRRQFLLEAALLSTSGGVVGIVLGAAAAFGVEGILHFPSRVTPVILATGLLLSTVVGLVAGYWPARNASNLIVVDALREEA